MKITGITKQGFHYSVDDAVGDDWEHKSFPGRSSWKRC